MSVQIFQVRVVRNSDYPFLMQSWLRHARRTYSWMPSEAFFRLYERSVLAHIARGPAIVAANPEYLDQVFGYLVAGPWRGDEGLLHFVLVKPMYRQFGIARALLEEAQRILAVKQIHPTTWTADLGVLRHRLGELRPDLFAPQRARERESRDADSKGSPGANDGPRPAGE